MTRARGQQSAEFVSVRNGGFSGLRLRELDDAHLWEAIASHEHSPVAALKDDARSRVTVARAGSATVVVKEVRKAGWRRRVADRFRGSPARRAFEAGHALRVAHVGVALPLAFVEARRAGLPVRSLLVSRDLRRFPTAADHAAREPEVALARLCDLALRLHGAGAIHGDLRAQHVHLCGPEHSPSLIDLEGVRFARRLSDAQRMEALAQLNASLSNETASCEQRDRALERYAEAMPFEQNLPAVRSRIIEQSRARNHLWGLAR